MFGTDYTVNLFCKFSSISVFYSILHIEECETVNMLCIFMETDWIVWCKILGISSTYTINVPLESVKSVMSVRAVVEVSFYWFKCVWVFFFCCGIQTSWIWNSHFLKLKVVFIIVWISHFRDMIETWILKMLKSLSTKISCLFVFFEITK